MRPPVFSKSIIQTSLSSFGLAGLSLMAPTVDAQINPDPTLVFGNANSSNTQLGNMYLSTSSLGNAALSGTISPGSSKFRFGAILFVATETGTYSYGQTSAPIDTVMMMYNGVFNPTTPGVGKLAGNDDTPISNTNPSAPQHVTVLGTEAAADVLCGTSTGYCPQVNVSVVAGNVYSLVVSHYSAGTYNTFQFPFTFYGTGNPVFYEYGALQPITKAQPFFEASELHITVEPLFIGGNLQMNEGNKTYTDDFRLSQVESNRFDLNGNTIELAGVLKDNDSTRPGVIRFGNGEVRLSADNTYTGKTIIEKDATLYLTADNQVGASSAQLLLEGGVIEVTENIDSDRVFGAQAYTDVNSANAGTISIADGKTFTVGGVSHTGENLVKLGQGTLKVSGTAASNATGTFRVKEGKLEVYGTDALGEAPTVYVDPNAFFTIESDAQNFADVENRGNFQVKNFNNANAQLAVDQTFQQTAGAKLTVDLAENGASNPIVTADQVKLAGQLELHYFDGVLNATSLATSSSAIDSQPSIQHTIFSSNQVIEGDFAQITIDGNQVGPSGLEISGLNTHDYLHYAWFVGKDATQMQYQVYGQQKLRWLVQDAQYQGQFTINNNDTFTLDTHVLTDQSGTYANWDGKSLVKKGTGTLAVTKTQSYTGNTVVEGGTLAWGLIDPLSPNTPITQNLMGNYTTKAGATTALTETPSYLKIGGNFTIEGDVCNGTVNGCFDLSDPLNTSGGTAQRGELKITPGVGNQPEIMVDGIVDIRGAYLNVNGVRAENPNDVLRASDLVSGIQTEHVIIHAKNGFLGSDVWGGSNASAGFANDQAPLGALDYLDGFASIVNCDPGLGGTSLCLYSDSQDNSKTQEYILSALELAWNYGGLSGVNNSITKAKNGNFTIQQGANFEVDVDLIDQDQGSDLDPSGSGRLGFNSKFGWWDGKTLTKKGLGTLYLSGNNTYTGNTIIQSGGLSIADASHLGNTPAIYLGLAGSEGKASLIFEASPTGSLGNNLGLNTTNQMTLNTDLFLGLRPDSSIVVSDAAHTVTLTGNMASSVVPTTREEPLSGTSWIKAGAGTLVLDPSAGKSLTYQGDTWIQQGKLILNGAVNQIVGDIYNQGTLVFTPSSDTVFYGKVSQHSPTDSSSTTIGTSIKSGAATLVLAGDSDTDWLVEAGILGVSNKNFDSDVTLLAGTTLRFDAIPVPLAIGADAPESSYTGKITGNTNSTIQLNRLNQILSFNYLADSTIGLLDVAAGRLNLKYASANAGLMSNQRMALEQLRVRGNGELALYGAQTALDIADSMQLEDNAILEITLDASNQGRAKISADSIAIGNNVNLNILGFGTQTDIAALKATGANTQAIIDGIVKASELATFDFLLLASAQPIVDEFANQPIGSLVNTPSYIVYQNRLVQDTDPTNTRPYQYRLGNFELAWNANSTEFTNGTFELARDTGLNIDVSLVNQTVPVGGFDSGWDGKTLTKQGGGLLLLSSAGNAYTGKTEILAGELALAVDNAIQSSEGVFIENDGILTLVNNSQALQQLQSSSSKASVDLMADGVLTLLNGHTGAESAFAGNIVGGDGSGNTNSTLKLANGKLLLSGQSTLDHVQLASSTTLELSGSKSLLNARDFALDQATIKVSDTGILSGALLDPTYQSQLIVNSNAAWFMPSSSEIGQVTLDNGNVFFGSPQGVGQAGRRLSVQQWHSNNGRLQLVTDLDGSQMPRLDTLVVNESGSGMTEVNLVDAGGFIPLKNRGQKILPIESGAGVGVLPTDSFTGGLTSGGMYYRLVYDEETGGFMIDVTNSSKTPEYQTDEAGLELIARGSSLTALAQLSSFTLPPVNGACEVTQAFGSVKGQHGHHQGNDQRKNELDEFSLQLGGDVYAQSFDSACIRYGALAGYSQSTSSVEGNNPLRGNQFGYLGKVKADSTYLGGYARYDHQEDWYLQAAMVGFINKVDTQAYNTPTKRLDGQTLAASLEFGMPYKLGEVSQITPSVQLVAQTSSMDDTFNSNHQAMSFDRVNAQFARVGVDYSQTLENQTTFEAGAHLWHQFGTETNIRSAVGEPISSQVGHRTWTELNAGVSGKIDDQWSARLNVGYQGNFNQDNSLTVKVGFEYRW